MRISSDICAMQHPSSGMSVITSVSITKKLGWSSIRTGIIRKKPIKRICGINSSRPRPPRFKQESIPITYLQMGIVHERDTDRVRLSLPKTLKKIYGRNISDP